MDPEVLKIVARTVAAALTSWSATARLIALMTAMMFLIHVFR